jgi:hypothetical protein
MIEYSYLDRRPLERRVLQTRWLEGSGAEYRVVLQANTPKEIAANLTSFQVMGLPPRRER